MAHSRVEALRRALTRPTLPVLLTVYFLIVAAFSGFETTFALFSQKRFGFNEETIGYLFAYVGVVLSLVQGGLVGRVVKRFGERRLVPVAIATVACGLALIPLSHSLAMLFFANGLLALGIGFNNPALVSLISQGSDPEDQGGVLGVSQSLASLARIVGPAWGGFLYDRFGMTTPYFSSALIMVLAALVAWGGVRAAAPLPQASAGGAVS
jgi:predicted MFS family arabinose efflux permease